MEFTSPSIQVVESGETRERKYIAENLAESKIHQKVKVERPRAVRKGIQKRLR
jgi:hypothetical protein